MLSKLKRTIHQLVRAIQERDLFKDTGGHELRVGFDAINTFLYAQERDCGCLREFLIKAPNDPVFFPEAPVSSQREQIELVQRLWEIECRYLLGFLPATKYRQELAALLKVRVKADSHQIGIESRSWPRYRDRPSCQTDPVGSPAN